jgi:prolyl oligopeptidase
MTDARYPAAERLDLIEDLHGYRVADPYRWLEDADDPRTKEWSAAQDELLARHRASFGPVLARFRERLDGLARAGTVSTPVWRGERRFFLRREPSQEHAVLLVTDADGTERALVDPMALDPDGTTTLDTWQPSLSGDRLAYGISTGGTEESSLYVLDVATGAVLEGPIDRARHTSVGWAAGDEEYFYQRHLPGGLHGPQGEASRAGLAGGVGGPLGEASRAGLAGEEGIHHRRIYRHRVGTDPEADALVFGADAERAAYHGVRTSYDGRWLVVSSSRGTDPRNDLWLADLSAPELTLVPVQRDVDARAYASVHGGTLLVWTDRDAPRGRICTAPVDDPTAWHTLIPEDPEAVLEDYAVIDGAGLLAVSWVRHAVGEVSVHDLASGALVARLALPSAGTVVGLRARPAGGDELWLAYHAYDAPQQVLHWRAGAGEVTVDAVVPGPVAPPAITTRQVVYRSLDGTPVHMFVLEAADADKAAKPTILYGYGGFDISQVPQYWPLALTWVESGGVFAVANLRGGGEEGEDWHRAGMLANKQNVFDDFHAAADFLVAEGIASTVGCYGGSNGGLLVGAALTQRPDRFAAVVCSAPLLDMVRYELFGLGPNWSGEYGSASDPEQLGWLLGYSPYHRVEPGTAYPPVLFTVFEGDTRVDPLHARKLAAALQYATTGDGPVLLRRETGVGHSARAVSRTVDLHADVLAFFATHLKKGTLS